MLAEPGRVDRIDAESPVREVEALDAVGVSNELRNDLAEPERHDCEVVAAQPQRGQADDDPAEGSEEPRAEQHEPDRDVNAVLLTADPDRAEMESHLLELARRQPAGGVGADCVEG